MPRADVFSHHDARPAKVVNQRHCSANGHASTSVMPRHTFQHRARNKRNACSCDHTGQHSVIRLHLMDSSRSGTVSMKPALEVATIRTIGAEGINVTAINLTGTGYWRISCGVTIISSSRYTGIPSMAVWLMGPSINAAFSFPPVHHPA